TAGISHHLHLIFALKLIKLKGIATLICPVAAWLINRILLPERFCWFLGIHIGMIHLLMILTFHVVMIICRDFRFRSSISLTVLRCRRVNRVRIATGE